jgi:hypothetical protein
VLDKGRKCGFMPASIVDCFRNNPHGFRALLLQYTGKDISVESLSYNLNITSKKDQWGR